jgi:hypothetical protein
MKPAIVFLLALLATQAQADEAQPGLAVDLQHFRPDPTGNGLMVTHGADTLGRWVPRGHFSFHGAVAPLRLPYGGTELVAVTDLVTMDVAMALGFGPADISFRLPLHVREKRGDAAFEVLPSGDGGVGPGDMEVAGKIRILDPKSRLLGLAIRLPVTIPSGDPDRSTSFGTPTFAPAVVAEMRFPKVRLLLDIAPVVIRPIARRWGLAVTPALSWASGAEFDLHPLVDLTLELWGEAPWAAGDGTPIGNFGAPHEWMVAARIHPKDWITVHAGIGTGIGVGWSAPRLRLLAGVTFGSDWSFERLKK